MNIDINNPRLKIFLAVLLIILLAVIVITAYVVNQRIKKESQIVPAETEMKKELTREELLQSVTASESNEDSNIKPSEDVVKSVTAPRGTKPVPVSQEVIDSLTAK